MLTCTGISSIVKTDSVDSVKEEDIPASSNTWKVASYISFVVIVGLIVLNIIPRTGNREIIDKSIAVLPFRNESSDDEITYFINGMMESILDNLSRVEDLIDIQKEVAQLFVEEIENGNIKRAEALFLDALSYDSAFGGAYLGLAYIFAGNINRSEELSGNYGDSVIIYTSIALSYDDQLYDA